MLLLQIKAIKDFILASTYGSEASKVKARL
jgi:hypothetical protein